MEPNRESHGVSASEILARRATQVQRGEARASVLGINDGLVSTLCLVVAVAAAGGSNQEVLTAGFAGLIAGAVSMAAGEWISVKSQVDLFEGVLGDLRKMIKDDKQLLKENLAKTFEKRGVSPLLSEEVAADIAKSDSELHRTYASDAVGINIDELGSPWRTAISSFALFVVGSLVPLSPWIFGGGSALIIVSIALTALSGLFVGAYIAHSSGKSVIFGALRQLFIIALASAVTYGVGTAFGVLV